jgi:hypothetical protein
MEKIEKGLALEELEAQSAELLPDRLEMRRRRRRGRGHRNSGHGFSNSGHGFRCSPSNVQVGGDNDLDQDIQCFRIS